MSLAMEAAGEPPEAVGGDHAMTGNREHERIPRHQLPHRPCSAGTARRLRDLPIRPHLAVGDVPDRLVDAAGKGRGPGKLNRPELDALAAEVALETPLHVLHRRRLSLAESPDVLRGES